MLQYTIDANQILIITNVTEASRGWYYCIDSLTNVVYTRVFLDVRDWRARIIDAKSHANTTERFVVRIVLKKLYKNAFSRCR